MPSKNSPTDIRISDEVRSLLCDRDKLERLEEMEGRLVDQFALLKSLPHVTDDDLQRALDAIIGDRNA